MFFLFSFSIAVPHPLARLLDGQIPYKDFQDYLGLGHLFIGSLFYGKNGLNYSKKNPSYRKEAAIQQYQFLGI